MKKNLIIKLRKEGKSYKEISILVNSSIKYVSEVCKDFGIGYKDKKLTEFEIEQLREFYKTHTIKETMTKFNISKSTVMRNTDKKRILISEEEKKERGYSYVKSYREKIKKKELLNIKEESVVYVVIQNVK